MGSEVFEHLGKGEVLCVVLCCLGVVLPLDSVEDGTVMFGAEVKTDDLAGVVHTVVEPFDEGSVDEMLGEGDVKDGSNYVRVMDV